MIFLNEIYNFFRNRKIKTTQPPTMPKLVCPCLEASWIKFFSPKPDHPIKSPNIFMKIDSFWFFHSAQNNTHWNLCPNAQLWFSIVELWQWRLYVCQVRLFVWTILKIFNDKLINKQPFIAKFTSAINDKFEMTVQIIFSPIISVINLKLKFKVGNCCQ